MARLRPRRGRRPPRARRGHHRGHEPEAAGRAASPADAGSRGTGRGATPVEPRRRGDAAAHVAARAARRRRRGERGAGSSPAAARGVRSQGAVAGERRRGHRRVASPRASVVASKPRSSTCRRDASSCAPTPMRSTRTRRATAIASAPPSNPTSRSSAARSRRRSSDPSCTTSSCRPSATPRRLLRSTPRWSRNPKVAGPMIDVVGDTSAWDPDTRSRSAPSNPQGAVRRRRADRSRREASVGASPVAAPPRPGARGAEWPPPAPAPEVVDGRRTDGGVVVALVRRRLGARRAGLGGSRPVGARHRPARGVLVRRADGGHRHRHRLPRRRRVLRVACAKRCATTRRSALATKTRRRSSRARPSRTAVGSAAVADRAARLALRARQ